MEEMWKPIPGYEGYYEVSDKGRVRGLIRYVNNKCHNGLKIVHKRIKRHDVAKNGRVFVQLSKNGINKRFSIHRLMALAFIPNPLGLPQVNHKDENPRNNTLDNLEWCTSNYNCNYGTRNKRISESKYKPITLYNDSETYHFVSQQKAAKFLGVDKSVLSVAKKKNKSVKGFLIKK